ncbi:MAG: type II toxin-antitoxin system HicA family toxin [Pseudomonadota bacterium]
MIRSSDNGAGRVKHPVKSGRVTVPGKPGKDLHPATLNSILKQAGLKR